ncbi:uncharacterized protein [Primulina huaijiensis]|uniref:uncharacterized protein n=1 Tax=Primulina huaijiensis TaxID=1492673 RepID=UPI003CC76EAB
MDYETEDYIDDFYSESSGFDDEYEFDASRFFDFTRAEFDSEIEEAERWFEVSGDYPNSPFIVKLNLEKLLSVEAVYDNASAKGSSSLDIDSIQGFPASEKNTKGKGSQVLQDTSKAKKWSAGKLFQTRGSTLMKPTASHLAKQNKMRDMNSSCSCTRLKNSTIKVDGRHSGFDNLATKRQKLEIGYLRKVALLKHQIVLLHKSSKKVTVPREPELETQLRAQRRRSKNISAPSENERTKGDCTSKVHPSNKKILRTSSLPKPIKSQPQVPQFQVFNLRTMQRASQHSAKVSSPANKTNPHASSSATDLKRPISRGSSKPEKHEASIKSKGAFLREKVFPMAADVDPIHDVNQEATTLMEPKFSSNDKLVEIPPTEQFNKLSLGPDINSNNASQLQRRVSIKASKENAPNSFQPEFWRCHGKPAPCGDSMKVHETGRWSNLTRSLGIH